MPQVINLGQVSAIKVSSTPPINTKLLWYDTNITSGVNIKYYDLTLSQWVLLNTGIGTEINDSVIGLNTTWSSQKIKNELDNIDLSNYYTKTDLQTQGQAQVHWDNITNAPGFITSVTWNIITGSQSSVNVGGFNNDVGYITSAALTNYLQIGDNVSELFNDAGYITSADIPSAQSLTWDFSTGALSISAGNSVNLDGRYSLLGHTHTIADITGLQAALNGKEDTFSKGNLVAGNNVTLTGTLTSRLVGAGDIIIDVNIPPVDLSNYYTKTELQTSGSAQVHWDNITNTPSYVPTTRTITPGTGITGGGNLSSNITIAFDTTWGDARYSQIGHTHTIGDITGLQTALDNKVNTSTTMTAGYGIDISGSWSAGWGFGVDSSILDARYLRKDVDDDNGTYTLTLGNAIIETATVESDLILPSLADNVSFSYVLTLDDATNTVTKSAFDFTSVGFMVQDGSGVNQFFVPLQDSIRFAAAGDSSIAFNATTKTITITSTGGSGSSGILSVFGRTTPNIVAVTGDYNTSQVTESTNLYFTDARVRATQLTGLVTTSNTAILATDSVLQAFGKAQAQINGRVPTSRTLTVNGTSGNITVSGGISDLTANRTWTVNLATVGTAGTYTKVTTDAFGRIISNSTLIDSDIPSLPISKITGLQTALDLKEDLSNKATTFSTLNNTLYPTTQAVADFVASQLPGSQTLALGTPAGSIQISGGNTIVLPSLSRIDRPDANIETQPGFYVYSNTTGSINYGVSGGIGTGFRINRNGSANALGSLDIWQRQVTGGTPPMFRYGTSATNYSPWYTFASQEWVTTQIPTVPTNYVTTNSVQIQGTLTGAKLWGAHHGWLPNSQVGVLQSGIDIGFASPNGAFIRGGQNLSATQSFILRGYAISGVQLQLNEGGIDAAGNSTFASSVSTPLIKSTTGDILTIQGETNGLMYLSNDGLGIGAINNSARASRLTVEGNIWATDAYILGLTNTPIAEFGLDSNVFIRTMGTQSLSLQTNTTTRILIAGTGAVTISSLAGTGDRMVVANSSGQLSTQAIPSGSGSQTLSFSAPGQLSISGGNSVNVSSLYRYVLDTNFETWASTLNGGGLYTFSSTTGTTSTPTAGGGGIIYKRNGTINPLGTIALFASDVAGNNNLYYRTGNTNSTWDGWRILANQDWVSSNFINLDSSTQKADGIKGFTQVRLDTSTTTTTGSGSWGFHTHGLSGSYSNLVESDLPTNVVSNRAETFAFSNTTASTWPLLNAKSGYGFHHINTKKFWTNNAGIQFAYAYDGSTSTAAPDAFYYRYFSGSTTVGVWQTVASREWVTTQIPVVPTNIVTTNTTQTNLSGIKTWTNIHTWGNGATTAHVSPNNATAWYGNARDDGTTFARYHIYGKSSSGGNAAFRQAWYDGAAYMNIDVTSTTVDFTRRLKSVTTTGYVDIGSTNASYVHYNTDRPAHYFYKDLEVQNQLRIDGGGNTTFTNAGGPLALKNSSSNPYLSFHNAAGDRIGYIQATSTILSLNSAGTTTRIMDLAGTGNRMVIANANGDLSTQAIPINGVTSITTGEGLTGGAITSTGTISVANRMIPETSLSLGASNLNDVISPGFYHQTSNANATVARNYPSTNAGALQVYLTGANGATSCIQVYVLYTNGATYKRASQNGVWSGWINTSANTTYSAGNGLTLSGTTFALGTPSNITLSSTNSVTATSHTHAFEPGGTTAQYIRGDGSLATFPTIPAAVNLVTVGSTSVGAVRYNGTSVAQGQFYAGSANAPSDFPSTSYYLNLWGYFRASELISMSNVSGRNFKYTDINVAVSNEINMAYGLQRMPSISANTTYTLTGNSDGLSTQASVSNTSSNSVTVTVTGAVLLGSNIVGANKAAVISVVNFGGGQVRYTVVTS